MLDAVCGMMLIRHSSFPFLFIGLDIVLPFYEYRIHRNGHRKIDRRFHCLRHYQAELTDVDADDRVSIMISDQMINQLYALLCAATLLNGVKPYIFSATVHFLRVLLEILSINLAQDAFRPQ